MGGEDLEPKAQGVGYPRAPASERAISSSGRDITKEKKQKSLYFYTKSMIAYEFRYNQ